MDNNIGIVFNKWQEYLERRNRQGLFIYLSDHGDQNGERGLYGKKTPVEASTRIPLLF
ncbi:MAG TPA: hypothetical protein GXX75_15275 [Clostridiales bacterium]|nr:hypothetical protein [Clostridiales bacterium]